MTGRPLLHRINRIKKRNNLKKVNITKIESNDNILYSSVLTNKNFNEIGPRHRVRYAKTADTGISK